MASFYNCQVASSNKFTFLRGRAFDWRNPTLSGVYNAAELVEIAKLWAKLIVSETMIRVVHRGANANYLLQKICERADVMIEQALAETSANDVATAAYSEVKQMSSCVLMLLGS
eukprot:4867264-Amphidinium_carterae.1